MIHAPQQHHWRTFATLYDPDADDEAPEATDAKPDVLAMVMNHATYRKYRLRLLARNPVCFYCGTKVDDPTSSLDHVVPDCRGGRDVPGNLQLCCVACNQSKGDATPVEWLADLQVKIDQLTAQAGQLAAVIEAEGLADYQPTRKRHVGKKGKAGRPSGPAEAQPSWNMARTDFRDGKPEYQIVSTDTGKRLIRGLKLQDAVHYLLTVGADPSISLASVTPMYHEGLGLLLPAVDPDQS